MVAIDNLLASVEKDGLRISNFQIFGLGRVVQPAWKERISDCYIEARRKSGINVHPGGPELVRILKDCHVFDELDPVFSKHGVKIALASAEKIEEVHLRNLEELAKEGISETWAQRHKNADGIVPIVGIFFFVISAR
jgi:hypothetical protein